MANKHKIISNYIQTFLQKNCTEKVVTLWNSKEVQNKFKSIVNKKERKRDPKAPKRAKSAYLYFCEKYRGQVKKELGDNATATNITKELGKRWNKLKKKGGKELNELQKSADADKQRYLQEKETYEPSDGFKKQSKGPKRAKSAYLYFCEINRPTVSKKLGNVPTTEITKKLGKMWNDLKKSGDISKYETMAEKDRQRYEKEKSVEKPVQKARKKNSTKKKVVESTPTTRKKTGYQIFCASKRPELKKANPSYDAKDITKELSRLWRSLDQSEKDSYKGNVKSI